MSNKMVLIEDTNVPNILVNGIKFELFCEMQAKDGTFQSLFIKEGGSEVVVEIGKKSAVVGAFSIEESKLRQLFDYIEATASPNGGLICYESEKFPHFLSLAEKAGGRYPIIKSDINPPKRTFFAGFFQHLRPQFSLDKALQDLILEHMAPVEHIYHSISGSDYDALHENDITSSFFPAESLPSGWEWKEWDDGSGHLNSPVGKRYFFYDLAPYANEGGIEYKETSDGLWDVFWGSMPDFMGYAETVVNEKYLDNVASKAVACNGVPIFDGHGGILTTDDATNLENMWEKSENYKGNNTSISNNSCKSSLNAQIECASSRVAAPRSVDLLLKETTPER